MAGVSCTDPKDRLLFDFAFLIHNVFAHHRIVLFHLELIRRGTLVLVCGIKMSRTSG
jgi:hypothetical protein